MGTVSWPGLWRLSDLVLDRRFGSVLVDSVISCTSVLAGTGVATCVYHKLAWPGRAVCGIGCGAGSSFWVCVLVEMRVRVFCSLFDLGQEPAR